MSNHYAIYELVVPKDNILRRMKEYRGQCLKEG